MHHLGQLFMVLWLLAQVETGWNGFVYVCDGQGSISGTRAAREQVGLFMTTDLNATQMLQVIAKLGTPWPSVGVAIT